MIAQGFVPPRDVWFFSSDGEEIAAPTATHAVQWLREHNIHPYMVLDEGGAVATDAPLGVTEPVAMVGVSEKGHVDLTVTARATAAMPLRLRQTMPAVFSAVYARLSRPTPASRSSRPPSRHTDRVGCP